jgi:hypothetical protein
MRHKTPKEPARRGSHTRASLCFDGPTVEYGCIIPRTKSAPLRNNNGHGGQLPELIPGITDVPIRHKRTLVLASVANKHNSAAEIRGLVDQFVCWARAFSLCSLQKRHSLKLRLLRYARHVQKLASVGSLGHGALNYLSTGVVRVHVLSSLVYILRKQRGINRIDYWVGFGMICLTAAE